MTGSSARIRELERANLFIVSLDEQGTWFRFHRLFAQLLRSELADESPDLEPELHRRASAWHADHGPVEAAVEHAVAAGDRVLAGSLMVRSWQDFARTGEYQTFERLIAFDRR
jgi:LuxR family maltose regulon positive regulatory protein